MSAKLLFPLVAILLLQACAMGPQRTLLSQADKEAIESLHVYNLVIQDEVRPAMVASNVSAATGGGLIPLLIDSSVNKNRSNSAQDIIEPLYNATEEIDYRLIIAKHINGVASDHFVTLEQKEKAEKILLNDKDLNLRVRQLKSGESLMYVSNTYALVNNSRTLRTSSIVAIFNRNSVPANSRTFKFPNPVYFNVFHYLSDSHGEGEHSSIALWSDNDGELFYQTLLESAENTAYLLAKDLQNQQKEVCGEFFAINSYNIHNHPHSARGRVIERSESRVFLQDNANQQHHSVPTSNISVPRNYRSQMPAICKS